MDQAAARAVGPGRGPPAFQGTGTSCVHLYSGQSPGPGPTVGELHRGHPLVKPCKQRPSRQGPQQLLPHWVCFSAGHQAEQRAREAQDPGLTSPRKHRAVSTEHQCPPASHASWRREVSLLSPEVELRPAIAQGASERHSVRSPKPALPLLGGQTRAGPRHSEQIGL